MKDTFWSHGSNSLQHAAIDAAAPLVSHQQDIQQMDRKSLIPYPERLLVLRHIQVGTLFPMCLRIYVASTAIELSESKVSEALGKTSITSRT